MKLYIAGPDVFRPDVQAWAARVRAQCAHAGHEALIPIDGQGTTAQAIYTSNIEMIRAADAVIANLNPFRGAEPDSGTCFEVGYAIALGRRVLAYIDDAETLQARVLRMRAAGLHDEGMQVEDFGLPLNLMLACSVEWLAGPFEAALRHLASAAASA